MSDRSVEIKNYLPLYVIASFAASGNKHPANEKFYVFAMLVLTCCASSFSQTILIKGQVKSKDDNVLPGVSVVVKGAERLAVTNENGEFAIAVPKLPAVLVFSYIGYKTQTWDVKKTDTAKYVTIKLAQVETELAEVVVMGYATAKKQSVTGAVSSVMAACPTPKAAVKKLKNDSKPESILKRASLGNAANSKVLTAGELSDFKKWQLWGGYNKDEFKEWSRFWGLAPVNRYCVQVQNKDLQRYCW